MSRRLLAGAAAVGGGVLIAACILTGAPTATAPAAEDAPGGDVFGPARVWAIHLEVSAKEYEAMQPAGGFAFGGPAPPAPSRDPKAARATVRNRFGVEFPWVQAALTADGKTYRRVGLRYAGDITYLASSRGAKRPLSVAFDRFGDQPFHGLASLHLHAMPLDPAKGREALACAVFRAAGVPAPRTAFAEVTLTVSGKYDKELLGLYTVVEDVDRRFLADRFRTDRGLLLSPFGLRGLDYLGDDWERYRGPYQPRSEPTREEAKRLIDFARLVNQAGDDQFRKEIASYLDVDEFLRFLAANALLSNVESFFALGHNYHLYLNPDTNRFVFLPGDLEFSLANFLLMGSAEQLMDLSLTHPYPGDNKLADRLLAIPEVRDRYQKLLRELSATCFTRDRLLAEIEAIERLTKEPLARERKAAEARREQAGGFGPQGGAFSQPPALRAFVEKRATSVAAQLAGKGKGYVPRFAFGPPRTGPNQPIDERTFRDVVRAPADFEVTLFAGPPKVAYPVAVATAPTGEVFVAVDEQGSLGRTAGGGRVLRCVDKDGDGKVDEVKVFARMEHPRGLIHENGSVWVMHPPVLSVFRDDDGDGVADREEVLVTGLTTELISTRGGDHTTNGIRLGLDGWIYIADGDYGIRKAVGKDGTALSLRGGGILRVRPDGTELEVFATGLRNPFDLGMDPALNLFTRDNNNDGGGWDIRVSHLIQTAHYGYTQLYANFPDEIMPTLGEFGAGSGTGVKFIEDSRWPAPYQGALLTGDWGRNEVYRCELRPHGPTFDLRQDGFLRFPRPTGMDLDANGHLYVASWRGGEASVFVGPNVGFVARVSPRGLKPEPFADPKQADLDTLVRTLAGPNGVARLHSQREILRRGRSPDTTRALVRLASDGAAPLGGRVAALFALKQLDGVDSHPTLLRLAEDATVCEFALRALTDRKGELRGLDAKPFVAALADPSPRVRAQALVSLGRLNAVAAARYILPLTERPAGSAMPTKKPVHAQPDADRVLPHLAVRALVSLHAVDACLEGLDGPHYRGALWALRYLHDRKAVEGLIRKLATARSSEARREMLATLIRLYYREADYDGTWWGIRPDSTGPYWDRREWELTPRIEAVLTTAALDGDAGTVAFLRAELARHRVSLKGLSAGPEAATRTEPEGPIVLPKADPNNPNQIGNLTYEVAAGRALAARGDARNGKALFKSQSCSACHTDAHGQTPKGPHLVEIGKRYNPAELVESVLKPSAKIAQGFETYRFEMTDGRVYTGFVVSESAQTVLIRETTGVPRELKRNELESRQRQEQSAMPEGVVNNLTPEQLADLIAYLRSLE
jgi:putative membrane-bound dehydrogenase-like protein